MLTRLDTAVENDMHRVIAEGTFSRLDRRGYGSWVSSRRFGCHNMHWVDGELVGILDWDYAAVWDTALNATYLNLWHGIALEDITDQPNRARVWSGALGLYALADALSWKRVAGWLASAQRKGSTADPVSLRIVAAR